jgi:HisA/HisF family protein
VRLVAVVDLLKSRAVHARRGDRARYEPLDSTLCEGSDPVRIARALLDVGCFEALYIADLDAILKRGDNLASLRAIAQAQPATPLWIDAGVRSMSECERLREIGDVSIVVGSEALSDIHLIELLVRDGRDFVLSLDFRGEEFLGPVELLDRPDLWPANVLAMNLARVGSAMGPDLSLIRLLHDRAPSNCIFASGGVRGEADLQSAARSGACGALLATCVHDGSLTGHFSSLREARTTI